MLMFVSQINVILLQNALYTWELLRRDLVRQSRTRKNVPLLEKS